MKTLKRLLFVLVALCVVIGLLVYAEGARTTYLAYENDDRGYMGLNTGDSTDGALYLLGYPQDVVGQPEPENIKGFGKVIWDARVYQVDGKDPKNAIPAGKTINDYFEWEWDRDNDRIDVTLDPKSRRIIKVGCYVDPSRWDWACPRIFGVSTESHEDEVRERLGQPDWVKQDGTTKSLGYENLGLVLTLTQQRVYMLEKLASKGTTWQWKLRHILL